MNDKDFYQAISTLNSNDLLVLSCVRDREKNTGNCSARGTIKAVLVEKSGLSISTINRSVKKLIACGLLGNGVKQVNKTTFYITEKGISLLRDFRSGK